jgi:peptidoglycan lytic transglycosylase G
VTRRDLRRIAFVALGLAAVAFLWALFQPLAPGPGDAVRVQIPKQAGVGEIADLLAERGVVSNAGLFELRATLGGDRDDLKPGLYRLREDMTYGDAIDRLVAGPSREIVQLTIPEGLSRREIAPLAGRAGVQGNYLRASADTSLIDTRALGRQSDTESLEGLLFPATYELRSGAPALVLVRRQLAAFRQSFAGVDRSYARSKNLTAWDVITIASMIEREAQVPRERPLIAAVIYNRLKAGIPLGIDATIRYATENWQQPLTRSQLALDSPYNTRTNAGLPPGPIGNPGLASLQAAARPARVGYQYYVVKPGTCGEHAFSSSFAGFERDRQRYDKAREAAGGRSPTSCP